MCILLAGGNRLSRTGLLLLFVRRRIQRSQHSAAGDAAQRSDSETSGTVHKERDRHALSDGTAVYHAVNAAAVSPPNNSALAAFCTSDSSFSQPAPRYCASTQLVAKSLFFLTTRRTPCNCCGLMHPRSTVDFGTVHRLFVCLFTLSHAFFASGNLLLFSFALFLSYLRLLYLFRCD